MYEFKVGSLYNFSTLAPVFLGQSYENAKLTGIVDYSIAASMDNIDFKQASVSAYLPDIVPRDATKYTYLVFQTQTGDTRVLASVWIAEATITEATTQSVLIRVDNANISDALKIRAVLGSAGWNRVSIVQ